MIWNKYKINNHLRAAQLLEKIKNEAFKLIKETRGITEYEVQQFIIKQFKSHNLKSGYGYPIVAFRQNTSFVHYIPSQYSRKIKSDTLVLLDIWARLKEKDSPYADITWMAYKGSKIPTEILKVFKVVIGARDNAISFIRSKLKKKIIPIGREVDSAARDYIRNEGYGKKFLHTTGHSLGLASPHGRFGRISQKNKSRLSKNLGYTIEPGIYLKNRFGIRSEINFYISNNYKLIITSKVQSKIIEI